MRKWRMGNWCDKTQENTVRSLWNMKNTVIIRPTASVFIVLYNQFRFKQSFLFGNNWKTGVWYKWKLIKRFENVMKFRKSYCLKSWIDLITNPSIHLFVGNCWCFNSVSWVCFLPFAIYHSIPLSLALMMGL